MKRLILAVLLVLMITGSAAAQGTDTYFPMIPKGDDCMAMAILEISDGTTTVSLLAGSQAGFHLEKWRPAIVQPKGTGVYQNSSIAPGRELVFAVDDTANEVFNLKINDNDQESLIHQTQTLLRLLLKARNYGLTSWQDEPVWIRARAACETNSRYARIINFTIEELDNPYAPPFFNASQIATMDGITLGLERGHWLGNPPGVGDAVPIDGDFSRAIPAWTAIEVSSYTSFIQTASGLLMAPTTGSGDIDTSNDDGATWAIINVGDALSIYDIIQTTSGKILAGGRAGVSLDHMEASTDDGATWAPVAHAFNYQVMSLLQTSAGTVLATDHDPFGPPVFTTTIWRSTDDGVTWVMAYIADDGSGLSPLTQLANGTILFNARNHIYQSTDDGITWEPLTDLETAIYSIVQLDSGAVLAGGENDNLWRSDDNGATWALIWDFGDDIEDIFQDSTGQIFISIGGASPYIYRSDDDGYSWTLESAVFMGFTRTPAFLETASGKIMAAGGRIYERSVTTLQGGAQSDTTGAAFIANRQNLAPITHIFVDDGGVFGANLVSTVPADLLPAAPAVNDAVYFGVDTSITDTGPFGGLVFNLSEIITYTTSYTVIWEVWTGAAWVALTVQDGTGSFGTGGLRSVHWRQPSGWATTAVNGVTGYWVRARVSALVGTMTPPEQAGAYIYAPILPYVEIAAAQVTGDIPALAEIKARNRSDKDGPGGAGPDLYANRLLAGLRSYDRGETFQAYLNVSDEQNPAGVTVTLGTNTAFAADATAPTGRRATYNPGGVEAMATRATIALGPTIARDFYGTFHAFLRGQRTAGASADLTVRLQISTGSGGVIATTESRQFQTTTAFELIDFGQVSIPAAGSLKFSEMGDTTELRIQASAASGTPDLNLYDLILIPTDEYSIDAVDTANESDSDVGQSGGVVKLLDLDSVTNPKAPIRALVRRLGDELVTSIYNPITPGEVILQANALQRLWFLAALTSATGASYYWLSPPEISHSIQVLANTRYLGMRGSG